MSFFEVYKNDNEILERVAMMKSIDSICFYKLYGQEHGGDHYSPFYMNSVLDNYTFDADVMPGTSLIELIIRGMFEDKSKLSRNLRNTSNILDAALRRTDESGLFKHTAIARINIERRETTLGKQLIFNSLLSLYSHFVEDRVALKTLLDSNDVLSGRVLSALQAPDYEPFQKVCYAPLSLTAKQVQAQNALLKDFFSKV